MTAFPRTILPNEVSWPQFPTGLVAVGQSGKTQLRSITQVGRSWTESYIPLRRSDAAVQSFLATINNYWRNMTIVQIDHRGQRAILGTGNGTPVVNGANQTGSSIVTSGWTAGQTVLKAGDVILLPGLTLVYDVTADVTSDGSGNATIPINPMIFSGGSPTSGGAITTNKVAGSVTYRARLATVVMPKSGPNEFYIGLQIGFSEMP